MSDHDRNPRADPPGSAAERLRRERAALTLFPGPKGVHVTVQPLEPNT